MLGDPALDDPALDVREQRRIFAIGDEPRGLLDRQPRAGQRRADQRRDVRPADPRLAIGHGSEDNPADEALPDRTILLRAPTRRAILKAGAMTTFYDGPACAFLGPEYVTYELD